MSNVVDLAKAREEREPHLSGRAVCFACKHVWLAVAPVGTVYLQCPSCTMVKGALVNPVERDEPHWVCNCGNSFFACGERSGMYCTNCGAIQEGY